MATKHASILNDYKEKRKESIEAIKSMDSDKLRDCQKKINQMFYEDLKKLEHEFDITDSLMGELIIFSQNRNWYEHLLLEAIFDLKN